VHTDDRTGRRGSSLRSAGGSRRRSGSSLPPPALRSSENLGALLTEEDGNPVEIACDWVGPDLSDHPRLRPGKLSELDRVAAMTRPEQPDPLHNLVPAEDEFFLFLSLLLEARSLHRNGEHDGHDRQDDDDRGQCEPALKAYRSPCSGRWGRPRYHSEYRVPSSATSGEPE